MKKYLPFIIIGAVVFAAVIALVAFRNSDSVQEEISIATTGDKVEVLYFHLTRRCVTCQAVENVTRDAVQELYADEISGGRLVFRSMNLEDKSHEADAERVKATGQCLLIVSGDTRIDLTSEGFMYAKTKPEKLRDAIKKAVDPLLKAGKQD